MAERGQAGIRLARLGRVERACDTRERHVRILYVVVTRDKPRTWFEESRKVLRCYPLPLCLPGLRPGAM